MTPQPAVTDDAIVLPDAGHSGARGAVRVRPAIDDAERALDSAGVASARHDAEELAAYVLGCPRGKLPAAGDFIGGQHGVYTTLIARRAARVPLQHLTGSAGFRYLDLAVGPGVFVPRPETELVAGWCVEQLVDRARGGAAPAVVVDLCTGSGAIALSIAHEVKDAVVHAVECDDDALAWARRNVTGSRVRLHHADAAEALPELDGDVDLVVANPPYLPEADRHLVAPEVGEHDPARALWGGPDGLDGPRMVERTARRLLRTGGLLAIEHADEHGPAMIALLEASGTWTDIAVRQDLCERDRFVTARRTAVPFLPEPRTPVAGH